MARGWAGLPMGGTEPASCIADLRDPMQGGGWVQLPALAKTCVTRKKCSSVPLLSMPHEPPVSRVPRMSHFTSAAHTAYDPFMVPRAVTARGTRPHFRRGCPTPQPEHVKCSGGHASVRLVTRQLPARVRQATQRGISADRRLASAASTGSPSSRARYERDRGASPCPPRRPA